MSAKRAALTRVGRFTCKRFRRVEPGPRLTRTRGGLSGSLYRAWKGCTPAQTAFLRSEGLLGADLRTLDMSGRLT